MSRVAGSLVLVLMAALLPSACRHRPEGEPTDKLYASDWLAFVGSDDEGRVALAFDANRGRTGPRGQAQLIYSLWVEGEGVREILAQPYYRPTAPLEGSQFSGDFSLVGGPAAGYELRSDRNALHLVSEPLRPVLGEMAPRVEGGDVLMQSGSGSAVLRLDGRRLVGRVFYERLRLPGVDPLGDPDLTLFGPLTTVFLVSDDATLDQYHRWFHAGAGFSSFVDLGRDAPGFTTLGENVVVADDATSLRVTAREPAWGAFQWPSSWAIAEEGKDRTRIRTVDREVLFWWGYGAFSVAFVEAEIEIEGREEPVRAYGVAEVLATQYL